MPLNVRIIRIPLNVRIIRSSHNIPHAFSYHMCSPSRNKKSLTSPNWLENGLQEAFFERKLQIRAATRTATRTHLEPGSGG